MSRRTLKDSRHEPQFGYNQDRQEPYFTDPRTNPAHRAARVRRRRPLLPVFLVGAVLILFAGFLSISYLRGPKIAGQLPVITADTTPIKVKPDNPGGAEIPFQDTTVYDDLNQGKQKHAPQEVEHLLAPPEQPLPMPAADNAAPAPSSIAVPETAKPAVTAAAESPPAPPAAVSPSGSQEDAAPAITSENEAVLAPEPAPASSSPEPATDNKLLPPPAAPQAPAPAPAAAAKPAPKPVAAAKTKTAAITGPRNSMIQLGSFQDQDAAKSEWLRLQHRYSAQLSSLSSTIQKVDLGEKGLWYRLRAGPLTADKAKAACTALTNAKAPCIVSTH